MPAPSRFTYPSRNDVTIVAQRWEPDGPVRGVVQLAHGMGEHVRRYQALADALTARGYLVQGQDHRGHGLTAQEAGAEPGELGNEGWDDLLGDIDRLVTIGREAHPDVPLVLFGHSMGSFALQQYLLDHADRADAVVLTGTTLLDVLESRLDLSAPLDLSAFNAPFAPARTGFEWLSRDPDQVDAYVADPWCGFGLDVSGGAAMFAGARPIAEPGRLGRLPRDLPMYVAVGEVDPVGGPLVLAQLLVERYRSAGLENVTLRTYPEARHEILNETNRAEVIADVVTWIEGATHG